MSDVSWLELVAENEAGGELPISTDELASLARFALTSCSQTGEWQISILFTSDVRMQVMHREFMGLDSPTDIMTFPYEDDGFGIGMPGVQGGDLVISIDTARANAPEHGQTLRNELFFLELHGILHLLGWDDANAEDRWKMLDRQRELLDGWRKSNT